MNYIESDADEASCWRDVRVLPVGSCKEMSVLCVRDRQHPKSLLKMYAFIIIFFSLLIMNN